MNVLYDVYSCSQPDGEKEISKIFRNWASGGSLGEEAGTMQETGSRLVLWNIPGGEGLATHRRILPENAKDRGAWAGCVSP